MSNYEKRVLRLRNHVLSHKTKKFIKDIEEAHNMALKENEVARPIEYEEITKADIIKMLEEKGIEHNPRDKKEDLYNLLLGSD